MNERPTRRAYVLRRPVSIAGNRRHCADDFAASGTVPATWHDTGDARLLQARQVFQGESETQT